MKKRAAHYLDWHHWNDASIAVFRKERAKLEPALGRKLATEHAQRKAASCLAKSEGVQLNFVLLAGSWMPVFGKGELSDEIKAHIEHIYRRLNQTPEERAKAPPKQVAEEKHGEQTKLF